jgi:hypothetical protein
MRISKAFSHVLQASFSAKLFSGMLPKNDSDKRYDPEWHRMTASLY